MNQKIKKSRELARERITSPEDSTSIIEEEATTNQEDVAEEATITMKKPRVVNSPLGREEVEGVDTNLEETEAIAAIVVLTALGVIEATGAAIAVTISIEETRTLRRTTSFQVNNKSSFQKCKKTTATN